MRRVTLPALDVDTSCLGFGCASLGSRVDRTSGLHALSAAFDRGVDWFDVAPAYGAGEAEAILGEFLKGRRDRVHVCTKVGLAPPAPGGPKRVLAAAARRTVAIAPALRPLLRRLGTGRNRPLPLTPELIERSLEESLRRLRSDYVDLYALHRVDPADLERDEIVRALENVISWGRARAVAVAGGREAAIAALRWGLPFAAVQLSVEDAATLPAEACARTGLDQILHSVFGVNGVLHRSERRLMYDAEGRKALRAMGYGRDWRVGLRRLLLERAFALASEGVVLVSMMSSGSLAENCAVAEAAPLPESRTLLRRLGLTFTGTT